MKISRLMLIAFCLITLISASASFAAPGDLDTTFYGTGFHRNGFGFGADGAGKVLIQADGKIITVGGIENGEHGSILIVRYRTDGSLDPTFGEGGLLNFGNFGVGDAELQSDGKIVLGGSITTSSGNGDFIVTRYNPNGTLDINFGNQGVVTTDFNGRGDIGWDVAIQPDGKIIVAGTAQTSGENDFAVARYNSDGSPDSSFGNGGKKTTTIGGFQVGAYAVAVQPDGKIVVAGATVFEGFCFATVRYLPNGDLDTSFDSDGIVITNTSNSVGEPSSVVIQPDGKILLGGDDINIVLIRYNPNGSLDTTFGGTGIVRTTIRAQETCNELKLQTDGKIVVVGTSYLSSSVLNFTVLRYNTNGTLDSGFGTGGAVFTEFDNNHEVAYSVAIQPDGKIVAAGTDNQRQYDTIVIRYNPNGTLDATFGGDGIVVNDFGSDVSDGRAVIIQPDGKILIAGTANDFTSTYIAVARYNVNGTLDTSFGSAGKVVTRSPQGNARAIALQPDGKIIVAGTASGDFVAVRYNPNGTLDTSFDGDGTVTTDMAVDSSNSIDGARAVDVQADGKIVLGGNAYHTGTNEDDIVMARYNADGTLDTTFDGDGKVRLRQPDYQYISALKIQPDGKIAAVGSVGRFSTFNGNTFVNYDYAAMRFNSNGTPDTTFDSDGIASVVFGDFPDPASAMILQPDGKIIAVGSHDRTLNRPVPAMTRFNADGSLDSTFGDNGKVITVIAPSGGVAFAAKLQPDGKIVIGGGVYDNLSRLDLLLARYNANGSLDGNFGIDGISRTNILGASNELIRDVALDSFGRIVVGGSNGVSSFVARFNGDAASLAGISGRVTNANGQGIFGVTVRLSGTALTAPILARTNNFGYYTFTDAPIGNGYIVSVNSKRHTFANPNRTVDLGSDVTDVDFVSEPLNESNSAAKESEKAQKKH